MEIVTRWFGVFTVEAGKVVGGKPFPADRSQIRERWVSRLNGSLTLEEMALWTEASQAGKGAPLSRDKRFQALGALPASGYVPRIPPRDYGIDPSWEREILLVVDQERLKSEQDPSLPLCEAIRAITDMEVAYNLLGERLVNWWVDEEPGDDSRAGADPASAAKRIVEEAASTPLQSARTKLASQVLEMSKTRGDLEAAVSTDAEASLPNLSMLLGPMLAARLVAKAGGLGRLSKLPASTVQVLGAERAFFDHLRTGQPSPKYGIIFTHPSVLGAPGPHKGKMARTLAAKAAIAAKRDFSHAPALPALKEAVDKRLATLRESRGKKKQEREEA